MGKLLCSFGIALLPVAALAVQAAPSSAARDVAPAPVTAPSPVLPRQASPTLTPLPAPKSGGASSTAASVVGGKPVAGDVANPPIDLTATEMKKLKVQIKSVRLSLADTQGRLAVTEKELSNATSENAQLRSDNGHLRVDLVKAETVAKKSEDEVAHRRQEARVLQTARPSSGPGALAVGLLLSLVIITGLLAVVQFGQGEKLRTMLARKPEDTDDKRQESLSARLEEEQQRAQRLDEEINRLRATAESHAHAPAGSKREKQETMRRELRDARAAAEADKRTADERIQKLETELALITADKRQTDERIQKLEPELAQLAAEKQLAFEQVQKLEPEVARLTAEKLEAEERARKLEPELSQLAAFKHQLAGEKQQVLEQVQSLELELARLAAEKAEAQARVQQLEPELLVLRGEKQRLERQVAKAHEKLIFFGHDQPEETPPPFTG